MASPAEVSPALVGRLVEVLLVEGYAMPTTTSAAQAAMERTAAAAAGLVNAFTGAEPFEGAVRLREPSIAELHERLRELSPIESPDEYRAAFAHLLRQEDAHRAAWTLLDHVANPLQGVAAGPRVRQVCEVTLDQVEADTWLRDVPSGPLVRITVGHLPSYANHDVVRRVAWRVGKAESVEVVGTGPGARWFAEQLAVELDREITEQRRAAGS